jgi:hypothetical protein
MTILQFTAAIATVALLSRCSNITVDKRSHEIKRIVFATGGCYGNCPIQVIDIDSSLKTKYQGVKNSASNGFYCGTVSAQFWDTLNIKLESINYKNLDTSYGYSEDDLSTEIFVYYNDNKIKHIVGQSSSLPDSVLKVYKWLLTTIDQMKFEKTKDSFIFPTRIEKPIPAMPPAFYKSMRFSKPKKTNL